MRNNVNVGGRNLPLALLLINNSPILDNQQVGPFRALVARAINTTDTALSHTLGRVPNGYLLYRAGVAGTLYDASTGIAAWTASSISVRATSSGTYSLLVF